MDLLNPETLVPVSASVCGGALALFIFSLLVWTARDVASRTRDPIMRIAAILLILGLNLFGLVIYLLLRPPETLAERKERDMIEELLAREATASAVRRRVDAGAGSAKT